jgi:hypothetical protein
MPHLDNLIEPMGLDAVFFFCLELFSYFQP